jgi:hypothetical protein
MEFIFILVFRVAFGVKMLLMKWNASLCTAIGMLQKFLDYLSTEVQITSYNILLYPR